MLRLFSRVQFNERDVVRVKRTGEIGVVLSDNRGRTKLLQLYIAEPNGNYGYRVVKEKDCVRIGVIDQFQSDSRMIQVGDYRVRYRVIGDTKSICEMCIYLDGNFITAFKLNWLFDYSEIGTVRKCLDAIKNTEQVA